MGFAEELAGAGEGGGAAGGGDGVAGGLDFQPRAEGHGLGGEVDAMHAEMGLQGLRGGSGSGERGERSGDGVGRGGRADAKRNVAVVTDAGGGVPGGGGGGEIGGAAAADGVEKVGHVGHHATVAGEVFDEFALRIFGGAADEAGEGAAFAVRDEADAEATGLVHEVDAGLRREAALFEDDGCDGVIVNGELGVGRLGGIVVDVAAA